jgi:hypothetical protein
MSISYVIFDIAAGPEITWVLPERDKRRHCRGKSSQRMAPKERLAEAKKPEQLR